MAKKRLQLSRALALNVVALCATSTYLTTMRTTHAQDATKTEFIATSVVPGAAAPAEMKLVWADEFDRDGAPDPSKWSFEEGFVRNEEAQWYQRDNATVKDGLLIIEARREQLANPNYKAGDASWKLNREFAQYSSSSLKTRDHAA